MKIAIIGAGALGSLFGGLLAASGEEVWLFDPLAKEHVAAISSAGLVIQEDDHEKRVAVRATTRIGDVGQAELVGLFIKAPYTEAAIQDALPILGPSSIVLSLQNGLGIVEILEKHIERERILRGVTAQGSTFLGPGRVRHAGRGTTWIGQLSDKGNRWRLEEIVSVFNKAGLETRIEENLKALVWSKLLVNVGINALTAIFNVPNGELVTDDELRVIMNAVVGEAVEVARAAGLDFKPSEMKPKVEEVCRVTAKNISSMLQDVRRGSVTEIDYINGAIIREGKRFGLEAPLNCLLTKLIKSLEKARIPPGLVTADAAEKAEGGRSMVIR